MSKKKKNKVFESKVLFQKEINDIIEEIKKIIKDISFDPSDNLFKNYFKQINTKIIKIDLNKNKTDNEKILNSIQNLLSMVSSRSKNLEIQSSTDKINKMIKDLQLKIRNYKPYNYDEIKKISKNFNFGFELLKTKMGNPFQGLKDIGKAYKIDFDAIKKAGKINFGFDALKPRATPKVYLDWQKTELDGNVLQFKFKYRFNLTDVDFKFNEIEDMIDDEYKFKDLITYTVDKKYVILLFDLWDFYDTIFKKKDYKRYIKIKGKFIPLITNKKIELIPMAHLYLKIKLRKRLPKEVIKYNKASDIPKFISKVLLNYLIENINQVDVFGMKILDKIYKKFISIRKIKEKDLKYDRTKNELILKLF